MKLVNFKLLNVDFIYQKVFGLKAQSVKENFGYGKNLVQSLGLIFLAAALTTGLVIGLFIANKALKNNEKVKKLKEQVWSKLFFNGIIRVFI